MKAVTIALLKSFWLSKGKLALCILAATLSSWGISAMIYSYLMTERDFRENFSQSTPPDLILQITSPSDSLIADLRSHKAVLDIERREAVAGRIRNRNGNWMPILLFAAEHVATPRIGKFDLVNSVSVASGILIEKNGLSFLKEELDSVQLQFPGRGIESFAFGGRVHDPGQAPSQMEQALYGYANIDAVTELLNTDRHRFVVKVRQAGLNEIQLRIIGEELVAIVQRYQSEATITVPPPGEHPHQGIVDGIAFLQESFGTILSMLGAILLSLILITWLYPQFAQIGVMKAMGATRGMLLSGYLAVLGGIILIGCAFGMPLGYKTAALYNRAIAFIQNFTTNPSPLPVVTHALVLAPAFAIPILFALLPLLRVSGVSVQQALNHVFSTPFTSIFKLTQRLIGNTKSKYSVNNLFRNNQRTALLILLLAAGISLFTTGSNFRHSLKSDFARYAGDAGYGVTIAMKDSTNKPLTFLNELQFVDAVSFVRIMPVRYKLAHQPTEESVALRIYPRDYLFDSSRVIKGDLRRDCENCVYVSQRNQGDFIQVPLGTTITLSFQDKTSRDLIYTGVIKDIGHLGFYLFSNEQNKSYNEVAVRITDGYPSSDATRELDDAFLENDIEVRQIASLDSRLLALENHLAPMYLIIQVMGGVTVVIAMCGLAIVLGLSMQERARELGVMKAVGGTVMSITRMYQFEYLIITTFAIVVGAIVGYYFNVAICKLFGFMLINVPVPPLNDFSYLAMASIVLLGVQTAIIHFYVRWKLAQTSQTLLSEVY